MAHVLVAGTQMQYLYVTTELLHDSMIHDASAGLPHK